MIPIEWQRRLIAVGLASIVVLVSLYCLDHGASVIGVVCLGTAALTLELGVARLLGHQAKLTGVPAERYRPDLHEAAVNAARKMDIESPRVMVVDEIAPISVTFSDERVITVPRKLIVGLDKDTVEALVVHELAHLELDTEVRMRSYRAAASYVGFLGLWVGVARGLTMPVVLGVAVVYLLVGTFRDSAITDLLFVAGGLGAPIPVLLLLRADSRLEEYAADDVTTEYVTAASLSRGLVIVDRRLRERTYDPWIQPFELIRSKVRRLWSTHPPTRVRVNRLGIGPSDIQ
jgi:Zn-dependent protease with chaperone function